MSSIIEDINSPTSATTFTVSAGESLQYLLILRDQAQMDLTISCEANTYVIIKVLCLGTSNCTIKNTTLITLDGDYASADVYMLSLLKDGSDVQIHGNVTLSPDVKKVSGHLLEENIVLGQKIKIRTAPILDVRSSDVSASHGCRVERLDPKRLFYMQSRGLTQSQSQSLILDGYINMIFEGFEDSEELLSSIKKEIAL